MGEIMMGASRTLVLMYHQIEPSGVPDGWVPNALADARYGVGLSDFREQMDIIRDRKIPVVRLSDCLEGSAGSREPLSIVVTFDDGYASDLELAAPILEKLGIPATFFLTTGHLDRPGMLTGNQARDLARFPHFELGSHGVTHRFLSHLSPEDLFRELQDSFGTISELSGSKHVSLSAPGGRTSPLVARAVEEAGFRSLCTSRPGLFLDGGDRFSIPRLPIMKNPSISHFQALLDPNSLSFRLDSWVRSSKNLVRTALELPRTKTGRKER
jgi:peptidoglycan/xylan/chitin deacetylase (PgdA/CDA1 family)